MGVCQVNLNYKASSAGRSKFKEFMTSEQQKIKDVAKLILIAWLRPLNINCECSTTRNHITDIKNFRNLAY